MLEEFEQRFGEAAQRLDLQTGDGVARFWCVEERVVLVGLWGRASMHTVEWMLARHDEVAERCAAQNQRIYLALWYSGLKRIDPGTRQALAKWFGKNRNRISRVVAISDDPVVRMAGFTINMLFGNVGRMAANDQDFLRVLDGWVTYLRESG